MKSQVLWCIPVIPVLRRLRQEELEFEASLGYIARPLSQNQSKNTPVAGRRIRRKQTRPES
jgi:hypothetical protein